MEMRTCGGGCLALLLRGGPLSRLGAKRCNPHAIHHHPTALALLALAAAVAMLTLLGRTLAFLAPIALPAVLTVFDAASALLARVAPAAVWARLIFPHRRPTATQHMNKQ